MTLQFRSRIKSLYDFGNELKKEGKCCFANGTSQALTFLECFQRNGNFFQNPNATCPVGSDLGYCCACSNMTEQQKQLVIDNLPFTSNSPFFLDTSFGVQSSVTKCECDRLGGLWSTTLSSTMCQKQVTIDGVQKTTDARIPNACCSLVLQNGFPVGVTCQNVCGARKCADLAIEESGSGDPFVDTVFTENKTCVKNIITGVAPVVCGTSPVTSRMTTATDAFSSESFGPCFELSEDAGTYSYSCSLKPSFLCDGYWIDPATVNDVVAYCDHSHAPKTPEKTFGYMNPIKYTQQEFDALGLSPGDEFQGGVYIGIFKPNKPNATGTSLVYGALNFGTPQSGYVNVTDDSSYKKWAIIVNKSSLLTSLFYLNELPTYTTSSYYDGYANCYGEPQVSAPLDSTTIRSITGKIRNAFADYYIPSIVELMYFAEQHRNNSSISDVFDTNGFYCSTTIFTDKYTAQTPTGQNMFNGANFLYGINFSANENFGKSMLMGINTNVKLMLFRRIVIE